MTDLIDDSDGATSNTLAGPTVMAKESLERGIKLLRELPPEEECIDHFRAGTAFYEHIRSLPYMPKPPHGVMGGYLGQNIFLDETLSPDTLEARNSAGKVLQTFKLDGSQ